jgi:hypothetical protein
MSDKTDPRDAAINTFRERQAMATQVTGDRARVEEERARKQEADLTAWATHAFGAISTGVTQVSDDFARRGSPFIIRQRPDQRRGIACFEIHRSGHLQREATFAFVLNADGLVRAETDAHGASLPEGIVVAAVTPQWAEQAAEQVMLVVLKSQH